MSILSAKVVMEDECQHFHRRINLFRLDKYYDACCICDWDRKEVDFVHLTLPSQGGKYEFDNIVPLCPNHHAQLDGWHLSIDELEKMQFFLWHISELLQQ